MRQLRRDVKYLFLGVPLAMFLLAFIGAMVAPFVAASFR